MNLIKVTPLTKKRTKNMIQDLLPEYRYIRITNRGLVVLKKKWWYLKKTTVNITDLFISVFPSKIAESCKRKGLGEGFISVFNNDIYVMMQLKAYKKPINIVDYIWEKYNVLYREVPVLKVVTSSVLLSTPEDRYLPVLSPVSSLYIPGVEKLLKRMKKKGSVESLVEKISKIQLRLPQVLVRVEQLQFA